MKLSLARPPRPPAGSRWLVAAALNIDLPSIPSYSPRVGDELDAAHPFVQFAFAHHAEHLLVPASATTDELRAAYAANLFPRDLPPSTAMTDISTPGPLPDSRRMVVTKALTITGVGVIGLGTIVDALDPIVQRHPQNFAPAAPTGYVE